MHADHVPPHTDRNDEKLVLREYGGGSGRSLGGVRGERTVTLRGDDPSPHRPPSEERSRWFSRSRFSISERKPSHRGHLPASRNEHAVAKVPLSPPCSSSDTSLRRSAFRAWLISERCCSRRWRSV